jgi:hypothetical protein
MRGAGARARFTVSLWCRALGGFQPSRFGTVTLPYPSRIDLAYRGRLGSRITVRFHRIHLERGERARVSPPVTMGAGPGLPRPRSKLPQ